MSYTIDFNGGADGGTVATGGAITARTGTPTYSAAHAIHGDRAMLASSGTATTCIRCDTSPTTHSGSVYLKIPVTPDASFRFMAFGNLANSTTVCNVHITTGRVLQLSNASTTVQVTGTTAIPVGQTVRLDWQYDNSNTAAPILTVRLFLTAEGSVHDEQLSFTFTGTVNVFERINLGIIGGAAVTNRQIAMDTIRVVDGLSWATAFNPPASSENIIYGPADFYQSGDKNDVQATVHVPAGTMAGDLLIAALEIGATQVSAPGMPAGFSTIVAVQNLTNSCVLYARRIAPGTPGSPSTIADTDITFTWTTPAKATLLLGLAGGVDQAAPISDAVVASVPSSQTTHTAPATTASVPGRVFRAIALKGSVQAITKPTADTLRGQAYGIRSNAGAIAMSDSGSNVLTGAVPTTTWTSDVAASVGAMLTMILKPQSTSIGTRRFWGLTRFMIAGASTADSFKITGKVLGATSVRLQYSLNSDMSSPSYIAAQVPDSEGYVRFTVPSLAAGTTYYYRLMDTPPANAEAAISLIGQTKTLKQSGSQQDFKFAFGAGQTNESTVATALDNARAWGPDFFLHLGDLHKYNPTETNALAHQRYYESQIANASGLRTLLRNVPFFYSRSDGDAGPEDTGDSNQPFNQYGIEAAKTVFPMPTLADVSSPTKGLYHSFVVGRVRFIVLDIRNSDRSTGSIPQGSSKTMLGATQKQWLKDRLLDPEPVKIIVSDQGWNRAATTALDKSAWWSYDDERTEIGNFITANGVRVFMITGNDQKLHADDGTNNSWGGFAVVGAAPFDNIGGGDSVAQLNYNTAAVRGSQYGRVEVTDTGDQISINYKGWDALTNTQKIELTENFDVEAPDILTGAGNETNGGVVGGQSITVNRPANAVNGDYLLAQIFHRTAALAGFAVVPVGWIRVGALVGTTYTMATYLHRISDLTTEPANYTWQTTAASSRGIGRINRVTGVHATNPIDAVGIEAAHDGTTVITLPEVDPETPNSLLLAFMGGGRSNVTPGLFAAPGAMSLFGTATIDDGASSSTIAAAKQVLGNTNATGTRQSAISPALANSVGYMLTLRAENAPVSPTIAAIMSGGVTSTGAKVGYRVFNATSVRLAVSLAADMSSPVYSAVTTPTADGFGKCTIDGLAANTQYWYRLEVDGVILTTHTGKFRTFPLTANFGFLAASCAVTGSNDPTFAAMKDRVGTDTKKALFFAHLGDWDYTWGNGGVTPVDEAQVIEARMLAFQASNQAALYAETPLDYVWSDVDFGGSNSDGTAAAKTIMQNMYRKVWPSYDLPSTQGGIQRTWSVGRVRFIHTDGRSMSTSKLAADNSSKTLLGAEQKQWLKDQFVAARDQGQVAVWFHDNGWDGSPAAGVDNWQGYTTERQEIADYVVAENIDLYYIHGDSHTLIADDGSNNPFGGFPFVCVAPMHQQANAFPRTVSNGSYPLSTVTTAHQYGWFDVVDDGNEVTIDFTGYDGDGTERISMTTVFTPAVADQPQVTRWNGTSEDPYEVDGLWNGSSIVPAVLSLSE